MANPWISYACHIRHYKFRLSQFKQGDNYSRDFFRQFSTIYLAISRKVHTFVPLFQGKPGWRNGRRAGFRYQWSNIRIGSTPISGTKRGWRNATLFFLYTTISLPTKIKSPLYQSPTLPDNETPSIRNRNWQITHKRNQNKKEKQLVLVWKITFLRIKRNFWLFLLQRLLLFIHYADYTVVCNLYYIMHSRQQIPEKHKDAPTPANYM